MISHHDLPEISLEPTGSYWILGGSGKISLDLATSRRISKHSDDNRVHLKPTTTRRQPKPMNPLLLRVGCALKNHPPDLVQVSCGLGKNPTRPTHGQPYTLVPKVLEPNKLPLWQSMTKHITKNKMLKVKQPIQLKSSNYNST